MLINKHHTVVTAGVALIMTASILLAMGGTHKKDNNGQFGVSRPGWPTGLQALVNSGGCLYGNWVNSNDEFFFRGNAADFNRFVQQYEDIEHIRPNISVHAGPERDSSLGLAKPKEAYDWRMTILRRGHGAPRLPNGAVQEYVATIDVWIDEQIEWADVTAPKGGHLVSTYSGKPLYAPTYRGSSELATLEHDWLHVDRILRRMEDAARLANPLLSECKKEVDQAKVREGRLGDNTVREFLRDKEHGKERMRTYKQLEHAYGSLLFIDVLENRTEPMFTCVTCNEDLMPMYAKNMAQGLGVQLKKAAERTPSELWDEFTQAAIGQRTVLEGHLKKMEERSGFPANVLESAKKRAADSNIIFFYSTYLSVVTPKELKKQRGDRNVIGKKRGNALSKARKAHK